MTRTQRAVEVDIERAARRVGRAVFAARWAAGLLSLIALVYAFGEHDWSAVLASAVGGLVLLDLGELMGRGSQLAAGALLVAFIGTIAALYLMLGHASGVLGPIILGLRLFDGLRGTIDLAELRKEYREVYAPRQPQPGDLYTIVQGTGFSIAKLLALDPNRVHIRLGAASFPTREIAEGNVQAASHEHLPVDLTEFLRWQPELLRAEPLQESELVGYRVWRRIQSLEP